MESLSKLPIYKSFFKIKDAFLKVSNLVLKAPTGSGKSIGLPLLLLKEGMVEGQILVVQPRRIAARLLASRASEIMDFDLGSEIGYQVRFDNKTSPNTKIIYLTDGVLLRILLDDKLLSRVGLVIFDEFHERTLQMDTSLALLKEVQEEYRPSLRLIIASATLNYDKLSTYLSNSDYIELSSRLYPIKIDYRPLQSADVLWKKVSNEAKRCSSFHSGDILIFAPGIFEINKIIFEIQSSPWSKNFIIKSLFGEMGLEEQNLAIKKTEKRKIIVSTNIAETSLTIEGVQIVIDTGIAKKFTFDPIRGINALLPTPISKNSADQRSGRAGRMADGLCVRLWSEKDHAYRAENELPQIHCLELSQIYLNLTLINKVPENLSWLDFPSELNLKRARESLKSINAIDSSSKITERGSKICKFPLIPKLGMALLRAKELKCLSGVAIIFALMEERSPVIRKLFKTDEINKFLFNYQNLEDIEMPISDLHAYLGSWLYAKFHNFSLSRCREVGIHAKRCQDAEKLFLRFHEIAGETAPNFEYPNIQILSEVLLIAFTDQLAKLKNRGTSLYQSINGNFFHINKYSDVQNSDWVLPLSVTEKIINGRLVLQMEEVTEIDQGLVVKLFEKRIKKRSEVALDLFVRKVIRKEYDQLGSIQFNIKETESTKQTDIQSAYTDALIKGDLKLKNWNNEVNSFIARIVFLAENYQDFAINKFDEEYKSILFEEICQDANSWKEIKNKQVLPMIKKMYSTEDLKILDTAVPESINLGIKKTPCKITYEEKSAFIRVKIQDLYDIKSHPKIVFDQYSLIINLLAPNNRCVQVTDNIMEFWNGSYNAIKKELAGRYPKHEWR